MHSNGAPNNASRSGNRKASSSLAKLMEVPVAPVLWFLLGAWMMSIQFVDYPMDNHQLSFADVKEAVRSRRLSSMGFGGAVALCASIPLVNFFVVPAAVVGATLLWCRELDRAY